MSRVKKPLLAAIAAPLLSFSLFCSSFFSFLFLLRIYVDRSDKLKAMGRLKSYTDLHAPYNILLSNVRNIYLCDTPKIWKFLKCSEKKILEICSPFHRSLRLARVTIIPCIAVNQDAPARKRIKHCSFLLYAQLNRILTPTACKSIRGYRKKIPPFVGLF